MQQIEDSICYCCQAHRTGRVWFSKGTLGCIHVCHITRCLSHRTASIHALLPNSTQSTRCFSPRAVSLHTLPHSVCDLTQHTALSTRCLTLRATYVANLTQSHSTHCFAPQSIFSFHTLSRSTHTQYQLDFAVDKYWNTENNFIDSCVRTVASAYLLCKHSSIGLVCCVSTSKCWCVV